MHNFWSGAATLAGMEARRRSKMPQLKAFGDRLRALRGKRTRAQIAIRLNDLGVPLGDSTLAQYENGNVWAPDAGVLWGLSEIYGEPLERLLELLRRERNQALGRPIRDLIRHEPDQMSNPHHKGGSGVPAPGSVETRIQQLETELQDRDRAIVERDRLIAGAQQIARDMWQLLLATEDPEARTREARRRRTHRKTSG
jgi:transcriptional regulator with XRE-family HTH domain